MNRVEPHIAGGFTPPSKLADGSMKTVMVLAFCFFLSCSGSALSEYAPRSAEEKEIVAVLIQYQNAKRHCDLESFLDCLHENGAYHFGRGYVLTKKELKENLPSFWAGLQSGSRSVYPMNREMITGNYIISGEFYNPQIVIDRDSAAVTMTFMKWGWRLKHYISLRKENKRWHIHRLDWEEN